MVWLSLVMPMIHCFRSYKEDADSSAKVFKLIDLTLLMPEAITKQILEELQSVKNKITEMDGELHSLREEFQDTHMSEHERAIFAKSLDEESKGKTVSLAEMKRRFGF